MRGKAQAARLLWVVVLLSVWRMVLEGRDGAGALSAAAVLTYTLIAEVFAEQVAPKTDVEWALHDGGIATRYLQPMSLVAQFTGLMVGRWLLGLALFSLPLLLIAPLLGVNPLPVGAAAGALFAVSLPLAVAVGVALEFSFAALLVHMEGSAYVVARVRVSLSLVLSGALIPLPVFPWGLGEVLQYLPFASVASAPLQIYIGAGDAVRLIALQAFWAVALWALADWLWRANRERFASYGG